MNATQSTHNILNATQFTHTILNDTQSTHNILNATVVGNNGQANTTPKTTPKGEEVTEKKNTNTTKSAVPTSPAENDDLEDGVDDKGNDTDSNNDEEKPKIDNSYQGETLFNSYFFNSPSSSSRNINKINNNNNNNNGHHKRIVNKRSLVISSSLVNEEITGCSIHRTFAAVIALSTR